MKFIYQLITLSLPLICLTICYCAPNKLETVNDFTQSNSPQSNELPISSNPKYATANLIAISEIDPTIVIDLQYKGPTAIANYPLYPEKLPALVRPETALRQLKQLRDRPLARQTHS